MEGKITFFLYNIIDIGETAEYFAENTKLHVFQSAADLHNMKRGNAAVVRNFYQNKTKEVNAC